MGTQWLRSPYISKVWRKTVKSRIPKITRFTTNSCISVTFNFRGGTLSSTKSRFVEVNFGDKESYLPIQKHTRFIKRRRIFVLCCHLGEDSFQRWWNFGIVLTTILDNSSHIFVYQNIPKFLKRLDTVLKKPNESPLPTSGHFLSRSVVLLSRSVGYGLGFRSKVIKDPKKTIVWFIS